MQRINLWCKLYLYREKVIFFFLLLLPFIGQAQDQQYNTGSYKGIVNLPNYDDKTLHYGFTIGLNQTRFNPVLSSKYLNDSATSVQSKNYAGFSLGFIVNLRLGKFFDLRLLPTVGFYERHTKFDFRYTSSDQVTESTFIEFPLVLKFKSQRRKNSRVYVIAGIKPGIEAGAKKKDKKPTDLRTQNTDFCIEYGIGLDLYQPLFKFSPELRISHGLRNMLTKDVNPYANVLNKLTTHTVSLYLNFE